MLKRQRHCPYGLKAWRCVHYTSVFSWGGKDKALCHSKTWLPTEIFNLDEPVQKCPRGYEHNPRIMEGS